MTIGKGGTTLRQMADGDHLDDAPVEAPAPLIILPAQSLVVGPGIDPLGRQCVNIALVNPIARMQIPFALDEIDVTIENLRQAKRDALGLVVAANGELPPLPPRNREERRHGRN